MAKDNTYNVAQNGIPETDLKVAEYKKALTERYTLYTEAQRLNKLAEQNLAFLREIAKFIADPSDATSPIIQDLKTQICIDNTSQIFSNAKEEFQFNERFNSIRRQLDSLQSITREFVDDTKYYVKAMLAYQDCDDELYISKSEYLGVVFNYTGQIEDWRQNAKREFDPLKLMSEFKEETKKKHKPPVWKRLLNFISGVMYKPLFEAEIKTYDKYAKIIDNYVSARDNKNSKLRRAHSCPEPGNASKGWFGFFTTRKPADRRNSLPSGQSADTAPHPNPI